MKTLLNAIRTELVASLTYIRSGDIFVTEDVSVIPRALGSPGIGIKDGPIRRMELSCSMWEVTREAHLAIYVTIIKPGASVTGDEAAGKKGVLDISEDIHGALNENLLNIDGYIQAFSPDENESELFGDDSNAWQRKIITYRYISQESMP